MSDDIPVFYVTDDLVDAGAAVVKSIFPDASDEMCRTAAAGAFMAILAERENGDVHFAYEEGGEVFRFPTRRERAKS
jgi:hypothetical protein